MAASAGSLPPRIGLDFEIDVRASSLRRDFSHRPAGGRWSGPAVTRLPTSLRLSGFFESRAGAAVHARAPRLPPRYGLFLRVIRLRPITPSHPPDPAKWADLNMLALVMGRERTESEFPDLYAAARFPPGAGHPRQRGYPSWRAYPPEAHLSSWARRTPRRCPVQTELRFWATHAAVSAPRQTGGVSEC